GRPPPRSRLFPYTTLFRSHLESEVYRDLEAQILEQLREGDRQALMYLLAESEADYELLSGEWRVLFSAAADFYQAVDLKERTARSEEHTSELQSREKLVCR